MTPQQPERKVRFPQLRLTAIEWCSRDDGTSHQPTKGWAVVDFFPAMGGGPVRAQQVKVEGRRLEAVVVIHDGFELRLNLDFDGET